MPNYDEEEICEYVNHGMSLFTSYRFDDDDEKHCRIHWDLIGNPQAGNYADMGSGIGTFGKYANLFYPELTIYNVTNSLYEHQFQQKTFKNISEKLISKHESFAETSFEDNFLDYITFNESFGYEKDIDKTFREMYRILKPNGHLFIKEWGGKDNKTPSLLQLEKNWNYVWFPGKLIISKGIDNGLKFEKIITVKATGEKYLNFWKSSKKMQSWYGAPSTPKFTRVRIFCFTKK